MKSNVLADAIKDALKSRGSGKRTSTGPSRAESAFAFPMSSGLSIIGSNCQWRIGRDTMQNYGRRSY